MTDGVRWVVLEDNFPRIIEGMKDQAAKIVAKVALDLEAGIKMRAPVRTGFLRGSTQSLKRSDLHWTVVVGADYGVYVEYGTIYSAPHPFVVPSVEFMRPIFTAAMRRVIQ